ncbi:winged helix-turn-helix domain-containing protein [Vibrio mediterranei]|uniref:winged helix-turn-helix domain-containing protein n=1 Tax=Vibrio mediterranei TaxID=689 RepID=UPI001EFCD3C2|nr:winged helix-turn-helix domain-containing protein [Vibrio mediterranei]MCG9662203.1 winged helix-turn-helix domain-containing protein [Vibrio mediterranei]
MKLDYFLEKSTGLILDSTDREHAKLSAAESAVLELLIENRGDCVSRDDMFAKGWPGMIVVENALTMAIRRLRIAGIDIKTVPRKGYVLIDSNIHIYQRETKNVKSVLFQSTASDELGVEEAITNSESGKVLKDRQSHFERDALNGKEAFRKSRKYFWIFIIVYNMMQLLLYIALESGKPDVNCIKNKDIEACSVLPIPVRDFNNLTEGYYFYGYTYDEDNTKRFIKIH